jgi:hypothetical protein
VKNGKTVSDSEDNGDVSCKLAIPKLNKVLEDINEVMIRTSD